MESSNHEWLRFRQFYSEFPAIGLSLDLSRVDFPADYLSTFEPRFQNAFRAMAELEKGAIANPDENRMVGHYWLRNPALAPNPEIRQQIESTIAGIKTFASRIHKGELRAKTGSFKNLLLIGIGGSALGPQFVSHALEELPPKPGSLQPFFFDNTDPDGLDNILSYLGASSLAQTLCVVVSKSGGTKETRNGMLEAEAEFKRNGLDFGSQAVAITSPGSELDRQAKENNWLTRFEMWDWVGGRTSELSAVGLLPAALQGIDIDKLLEGARNCDAITRKPKLDINPSAQIAAAWYHLGNGKGSKNMVVLPYKDRLELFSKYLQQLLMESLGKERDVHGNIVHQGITVFGNKGSTDQHSYIQQLRDGLDNFFAVFIRVLKDRNRPAIMVDPDVTSGDYLDGFLLGTRKALYENGRRSITITIPEVSPATVGMLIALFERAVGYYASLIEINAYHQPGVEAGKKAATAIIELQRKVINFLRQNRKAAGIEEISRAIGATDQLESLFYVCQHLAANPDHGIVAVPGQTPFATLYKCS